MMIIRLLATLAAAACVGFVLYKSKVPGGVLVGAIIGAAGLNIVADYALMPSAAKTAAQIMAGAFIGCSVKQDDLRQLRHLAKPALIVLGSMLITNLTVGVFIRLLSTRIDLITALYSAVPGGISDIPMIASDMGADAAQVAVMQFARLVVGIGVFPSLIQWVTRREKAENKETREEVKSGSKAGEKSKTTAVLITLAGALATGLLGKYLGIPAGALVFSMLGVLTLKLKRVPTHLPVSFKRAAQLLSGAYIGSGLGLQDLLELRFLAVPMGALIAGYAINCFVTGAMLHHFCAMSRREGMLAATPAGASDMALISADLGVNSPDLVVLQVIRLIVVVSVFPTVIQLLLLTGWH